MVSAVLYEGYMLYPYRPSSVKNRQRWTIGGLCPEAYRRTHEDEASAMRIECLVEGGAATRIEVSAGFLHLIDRRVHAFDTPLAQWPAVPPPEGREVDVLDIDGQRFCAWQEATERRVPLVQATLGELEGTPRVVPFACRGGQHVEPLASGTGGIAGMLTRLQQSLAGHASITCAEVAEGTFRVTVEIVNTTDLPLPAASRDAAMAWALVSCHAVLTVRGGAFVSLLEPPAALERAASECRNVGAWPVLVGAPGTRDTMLASPIILYDYPRVAPQSPGDLFDATEIDEILTLRILALTEDEQREMAATDPRARALLERTLQLSPEQHAAMHGTLHVAPDPGEDTNDAPDPGEGTNDAREAPRIAFWRDGRTALRVGDQVRLKPRRGADIMDLALRGKIATIAAIERDFEDRIHVAVTVDEDPGRDLGAAGMPGHRFFFAPDEVEPLGRRAS